MDPKEGFDAQTVAAYEKHADQYDADTSPFWERFPSSFLDVFAQIALRHGTSVIDIGCGPGRDGKLLIDKGLQVVGLDASQAMLRLAASRGLTPVRGDLLRLPFRDGAFSGAWSYTSMLHVRKECLPQALAEARRVIKRDAPFALGMIEGVQSGYIRTLKIPEPRLLVDYDPVELMVFVANAGFKVVDVCPHEAGSRRYIHLLARAA